jgi:hypothetical protein
MKHASWLPCFLVLGFVGCATALHTKVYDNIHVGDSSDHVKDVLGSPDSFGPSQKIPGATAWYYTSHGSICGFTINDDKVAAMACDSSNYVSPGRRALGAVGAGLKGMGDGLQNSQRNQPVQTHCNPDYAGGYNCTSQ